MGYNSPKNFRFYNKMSDFQKDLTDMLAETKSLLVKWLLVDDM